MSKNEQLLELTKELLELIIEYEIWNDDKCKYCGNTVNRKDPQYSTYHNYDCAYDKAKDLDRFIRYDYEEN